MRVVADLSGAQAPNGFERGIPRYCLELATALVRRHGDIDATFRLREDLPVPPAVESLLWSGRVLRRASQAHERPDVFHILSPFELGHPLDRSWPGWARTPDTRLAVTVYDLIPWHFPEHYLSDPATRWRYRSRLALLGQADAVLAISQSAADDVADVLKVPDSRIHVVGTGVSDHFFPAEDPASLRTALVATYPWAAEQFLLYTGGVDFRKNLEGLFEAYAALPAGLRARHPLVIVCSITDVQQQHYGALLRELRVESQVHFTGYVAEQILLALYQTTHLFVFPSVYEGFGLPVAEAMSCHAPVLAGRNSSLAELVGGSEALFDACDPADISRALATALDPATGLRDRLVEASGRQAGWEWDTVADNVADAYRRLGPSVTRRRRSKPSLAFITPVPESPSGIATYNAQLLPHLAEIFELDLFVDNASEQTQLQPLKDVARRVIPMKSGSVAQLTIQPYDHVLAVLGNSHCHLGALEALTRVGGVAWAHDVRLTNLWESATLRRPGLVPGRYGPLLEDRRSGRLPGTLLGFEAMPAEDYFRVNHLMFDEVFHRASSVLVNSYAAAALSRVEAPEWAEFRVQVVPFAGPSPVVCNLVRSQVKRVASFGYVDQAKQSFKVFTALCQLAALDSNVEAFLAGPIDSTSRSQLQEEARQAGVADRVQVTGELREDRYRELLSSCDLAVQLRDWSNGESSAVVTELLAAGVPTIVTASGSLAELPDEIVRKVQRLVTVSELVAVIQDMSKDQRDRQQRVDAGLQWAGRHSFAALAEHVAAALESLTERRQLRAGAG